MIYHEITVWCPRLGEFMFHVDGTFNPVRMYVYKADILSAQPDLEWLDDEDERDALTLGNYREGSNSLFLHARRLDFVKRVWEFFTFNNFVGQ